LAGRPFVTDIVTNAFRKPDVEAGYVSPLMATVASFLPGPIIPATLCFDRCAANFLAI
jgi:hypothetical protein